MFKTPKWYRRVTVSEIGIVIFKNHKEVFIADGIADLKQPVMRWINVFSLLLDSIDCSKEIKVDKNKKAPIAWGFVRVKGLEPPRLSTLDPKSSAATNYAIPAKIVVQI